MKVCHKCNFEWPDCYEVCSTCGVTLFDEAQSKSHEEARVALAEGLREAKAEGWAEGLRAGESFERSLWQWQAGPMSRAVNRLSVSKRPERPPNPYDVTGGAE